MTQTTWRVVVMLATVVACNSSEAAAPHTAAPTVVTIDVTPSSISLAPGEAVDFEASARLSDSTTEVASVIWTATGGTITPGGRYTAGGPPGAFRAIATAPAGPADTSSVTIIPVLTGCIVDPPSTTLTPGENQLFTVVGQLSDGTTSAPQVAYSAAGGSITPAGLYEAGPVAGIYPMVVSVVSTSITCSSQVTVEEIQSPPGLGEIPELPAGYNLHLVHTGSPVQPSGWNSNGNSNLSLGTDAKAPRSPSDILRVNYPAGFPAGSQPVTLWLQLNSIQRIFFTYWIRYNSNFVGHPGSGVNKNMFLFHATANDYATLARFEGNASTMYFDLVTENMSPSFVKLVDQQGGIQKMVAKNQWHRVSVESIRQTSGNNGVLRMWVDGTLVGQLTNCNYPDDFVEFQLAPTWGGVGGSVPNNQYFELDELRVYLP